MLSQVHAELGPGVEVALGSDGAAAGPLVLPVGDVLPEGASALDAGLVDLLVLPDVVHAAVASDLADLLALRATSAVARVLLDVVLDERVGGPTVDGDENSARVGGSLALEADVAGGTGPPALTDDEVASTREVDRVAVVRGVELNVSAGLVVLVVVLTLGKAVHGKVEVRSIDAGIGDRGRKGARGGRKGKSKRAEGNHCAGLESVKYWVLGREA